MLTLLQQKEFIPEETILEEDPIPFESPHLGTCYAASIQGRDRVTRVGRNPDAPYVAFTGERCAEAEGFTLHANVHIHGRDRSALEHLIRYMARPAVASQRLSLLPDGRVSYRLRRTWNDGTHTLVFEPQEFIEKLAALVPPPRAHLVSYHGVFGPNAVWQSEIVPRQTTTRRSKRGCCGEADPDGKEESGRCNRYTMAELLRRAFKIDILECPHCHGRRRLIPMITDHPVIRAILECQHLSTAPPPIHPARWPP